MTEKPKGKLTDKIDIAVDAIVQVTLGEQSHGYGLRKCLSKPSEHRRFAIGHHVLLQSLDCEDAASHLCQQAV